LYRNLINKLTPLDQVSHHISKLRSQHITTADLLNLRFVLKFLHKYQIYLSYLDFLSTELSPVSIHSLSTMSALTFSDISGPKYGYDFVVATTQASINGTMLAFLSALKEPVVNICFVADPMGKPVQIDYNLLKQNAHGSDPFAIPANVNVATSQDIKNLVAARFMVGFRAQLGIPRVQNPSQLPDIVTLGTDTSAVKFNMLCSQFMIVQLDPGSAYTSPSWTISSQQASSPPWVFTSKVDLRLSTIAKGAYTTLPPNIQKQISNLGPMAFSVQQLLFDLTNATLESVPTITGVQSGSFAYSVLEQFFIGSYFTQMQAHGQPLLGCNIAVSNAPASTLTLSSFNFQVDPYVDPATHQPYPTPTAVQKQMATLNYLCAADGNILPPATWFPWNWVDASQINDHDGAIAINRNTFANYFRNQLASYVSSNCFLPHVQVTLSGLNVNYSWSFSPYQAPTVTIPPTGSTVLQFSYSSSSSDGAGLNWDMGSLQLNNNYTLTIDFVGTTIIVTQHQVVYMRVSSLGTAGDGNLVDKKIVDTYTLGINANGQLVASLVSVPTDNSNSPSVTAALNFFTDFNTISTAVANSVKIVGTKLQDMPINAIQNFVFPGGKTFIFSGVSFSNYQDLVTFIRYADPTGPVTSVAAPAVKEIAVPKATVKVGGPA